MVFAIIAWTIFLRDKQIEYRRYDLLAQLLYDYPLIATVLTLCLIKEAGKNCFAKMARVTKTQTYQPEHAIYGFRWIPTTHAATTRKKESWPMIVPANMFGFPDHFVIGF
jgi:hypothetical protein